MTVWDIYVRGEIAIYGYEMANVMNVEEEILKIKERNAKVELDKAWEISFERKASIAVLTYFFMVVVMYSLNLNAPFINAIIPTLGFILSTLSLGVVKKFWLKKHK